MEIKDKFVTHITYVDEEGTVYPSLNKNKFTTIKKIKERANTNKHYTIIEWTYVIRRIPEQLSIFE